MHASSLILLLGLCLTQAAQADERKPAKENAGAIRGKVRYVGKQPPRKAIDVGSDPWCEKIYKDQPLLEEGSIFGRNDTLRNVLIHVSAGLGDRRFEVPKSAEKLVVKNCKYTPHVLVAQVGQTVEYTMADATLHNVHIFSLDNASDVAKWCAGQPVRGMTEKHIYTKPELGLRVKCDVHAWMSAIVHVLPHPYFAVTGEDGTFEITGLPPGEYELSAWHEFKLFKPDAGTIKVKVDAGKAAEIVFTYRPSEMDRTQR